MASTDSVHLLQLIKDCSLRRLSNNFDQKAHHGEYNLWKNTLDKNIFDLRECFRKVDLGHEKNNDIISSLIILYKELQTNGDWTTENASSCAVCINSDFQTLYKVSLDNLLKTENIFNAQNVFDSCLEKLHSKLTRENFKKYPSLIQVYGLFLQDVNEYKIKVNPLNTLPIPLLLIEDYIVTNKIIGLKCCIAVLDTLAPGDFSNGNYHEVIYESLTKSMKEKDLEVTKLTAKCLLKFLLTLSSAVQESKADDAFWKILEESQMETNLHRKVELIKATNKLITINGINCVKRKKKYNAVMIENMDLCVNDSIREVLLENVLECIETWLKYCWYGWKYRSDSKMLSTLFKLLCAFGEDEEVQKVQDIIVSMIALCEEDERDKIIDGLKNCGIPNERFASRLEVVLKNVLNKFK